MRADGPGRDGHEPRQVHRLPYLFGHLQAGVDQPAGHGVRLVQQRRDPPRTGLPPPLRGPGEVAGRLGAEPARRAGAEGRRPRSGSSPGSSPTRACRRSTTTTSPGRTTTRTSPTAPLGADFPVARPVSLIDGRPMEIGWGPELGRQPRRRPRPARRRPAGGGTRQQRRRCGSPTKRAFMFYLPRICEHCLNPSCVASARRGRCTSASRTASSWSTRTAAGAGGCASAAARTRRCTSTTPPARPRSAPSATRASRRATRRSARRPASAGSATSASCSTTPTR
ncbi:hypothetical protein STENM327S_02715 [Streptomyces tendae]